MRFVAMSGPGGPEVLHIDTMPVPRPGPSDVLVHVAAAGVNRPDLLQRQGKYAPPPGASPILGLEIAGTVVAVGRDARRWQIGDEVCALLAGGGYAEYSLAPAPQCLPIPGSLSFIEAAGIPETFFTVWTNLFQRARLMAGETVLIHGGSSGIGTTAIQLARAFGARVFTTAGSAAKCAACRDLGAELAIDYRADDFVPAVTAATGGRGVDVILDMVGGPYVPRNIAALAVEGRLVQIAFMQGSRIEVDLQPLMLKRLTLTGSTLRPRSVAQKGAIARELEAMVWPRLHDGTVRPIISRTFPLDHAAEAHRTLAASTHIGKLILTT
jgi:putative PIG3 family NAD(P)H quinone oxidoreductase